MIPAANFAFIYSGKYALAKPSEPAVKLIANNTLKASFQILRQFKEYLKVYRGYIW
jgi:hypothetical protein